MFGKKEVTTPVDKGISNILKNIVSLKDQPLIMIKNISKSYRKKLVLKDVTFDVFSGDIFGLVGMSGSGKTTLFKIMSGMMTVQSGDVLIRQDIFGLKKKPDQPDYISVFRNQHIIKKNFGFASQIPSFYEHLTIEENLQMYGALYSMNNKKIKENISRLLDLVDLSDERDTLAGELSGGMQRRLDIACSLIHDPKILFLDEPTSDLDPIMRRQIWKLIKDIQAKGTTIILASHILEEVENLCTKVAIIHSKKVLGYGTLKELKKLFKKSKNSDSTLTEIFEMLVKKGVEE